MLSKAAEQCTEYLIKYNKITEQQKSIYKYGFELLVSTAVCIGAILVCGIFGGYGKETIIFLLSFIPIRITAGGYHAGSYGRCDRPLDQAVILADGSMVLCWCELIAKDEVIMLTEIMPHLNYENYFNYNIK